jgi:hypothetical protein
MMPLIPILALAGGFGGGLLVSNGIGKLTRLGLVAGAGYLVYTQVIK